MEFQTRTIGHLRSLLRQETEPVFLLGAGASVKSGVPTSNAIFEKIAKFGYCLERDISPENPGTGHRDWHPWLRKHIWYNEDSDPADNYPYAVDNILQPQDVRRKFFIDILNTHVLTSSGYKQMAELLASKHIRTVLTTNFDTVLLDWCRRNHRPHHVDIIQTQSDYTKFSTRPPYPQIIYLHGSVEHYTDKNNLAEIQRLDDDLVSMLAPLLRDHPLIVIGYRGAEPSVMKHLLIDSTDVANSYRNGIYWCVRNYEEEGSNNLTPFVHELADKIGGNFHIIDINGFDEVMEELSKPFGKQHTTLSKKSITTRSTEVVDLPYDFKQVNESSIDREAAIQKLSNLVNTNLSEFADGYGVTIFSNNGGCNKGWPGQVIERYLGGTINSSKKPDFGDWELKTTALELKNGELRFKYPMSITMINESDVRKSSFKDSGLLRKLRKMIIATTIWETPYQTEVVFYGAVIFDLDNHPQIYEQIEADYNLVRDKILNGKFSELNGYMGKYVQPRTKGTGHGSTSKAFYARAAFLSEFILPLLP